MPETMTPIGSNLLCTRASKREQKKANLVVPTQQGSGKQRRKDESPRVLELIVVAKGEGRNEDEQNYVKDIKVGDRIGVANSPVSIVYLNGDEHIILDAQFVEGIIANTEPEVSES